MCTLLFGKYLLNSIAVLVSTFPYFARCCSAVARWTPLLGRDSLQDFREPCDIIHGSKAF